MNFNDEEFLDFFNRLLERLHQADLNHGSNIELVYVASGAQHVNKVENQYMDGFSPDSRSLSRPLPREGGEVLPEALGTEAAMALWQKVQEAGYVDDHYQPAISRTQSAILADEMAERLGIKEKWKVFEALWNRRNMYRDYHDALDQRQSLQFRDALKALFR